MTQSLRQIKGPLVHLTTDRASGLPARQGQRSTDGSGVDLCPEGESDIASSRLAIARASIAATKLTATQADYECSRIDKMRLFLNDVEDDIFDMEKVKHMPPDLKLKVRAAAAENLNNSLNFLRGLNGNFVDAMAVLGEVERLEKSLHSDDCRSMDPELEKIKSLIRERIKLKANRSTDSEHDATSSKI